MENTDSEHRIAPTESLLAQPASKSGHENPRTPTELLLEAEPGITQSGGEPPRAAQQTWTTESADPHRISPRNRTPDHRIAPTESLLDFEIASPELQVTSRKSQARNAKTELRTPNRAHRIPPTELLLEAEPGIRQSGGEPPRAAQQTWQPPNKHGPQTWQSLGKDPDPPLVGIPPEWSAAAARRSH